MADDRIFLGDRLGKRDSCNRRLCNGRLGDQDCQLTDHDHHPAEELGTYCGKGGVRKGYLKKNSNHG